MDHGLDIHNMTVRERVISLKAVSWAAKSMSWKSGRIQDVTDFANLFRKSLECYRNCDSERKGDDDGFLRMLGQFIDQNNNDKLSENRNIDIADVDIGAV